MKIRTRNAYTGNTLRTIHRLNEILYFVYCYKKVSIKTPARSGKGWKERPTSKMINGRPRGRRWHKFCLFFYPFFFFVYSYYNFYYYCTRRIRRRLILKLILRIRINYIIHSRTTIVYYSLVCCGDEYRRKKMKKKSIFKRTLIISSREILRFDDIEHDDPARKINNFIGKRDSKKKKGKRNL